MIYKILGFLVLSLIAIQFVPYGRNHTNPPVTGSPDWDRPITKQLFDRTCANCHSNTTKWPWYSNIAPISWLLQSDVDEARKHFNVSEWGVQEVNRGYAAAAELKWGEMPPLDYKIGHPEARLDKEKVKELADGLAATFQCYGEKTGKEKQE